jgi:hypothetical protein
MQNQILKSYSNMGDSGKFVAISYWLVNLFIYTIMLPAPGIFEADYTSRTVQTSEICSCITG